MRIVFGTQSRTLGVEAPDGPVTRFLLRSFAPWRLQPDGEGHDREPELRVEESEGRYRLRSALDPGEVPAPDLPTLLTEVEYRIAVFLLRQLGEATHLHAAGAVLPAAEGGGALLALGTSGAGKSSVALRWSADGLPLLGDDVILLHDAGLVHPFPRPPKAPLGLLRDAGLATGEWTRPAGDRPEGWWEAERKAGWADGPVRAVVVASLVRDAEPSPPAGTDAPGARVRPLGAAEALPLLFSALLDTGAPPAESLPRLTDLLASARAWEVRFTDPRAAARAVRNLAT